MTRLAITARSPPAHARGTECRIRRVATGSLRRRESTRVVCAVENDERANELRSSSNQSTRSGAVPDIGDAVGVVEWGGRLPSTRRLLLSSAGALGIVIGGNLFGTTSALLSLDGGATAAALRLDVIVPVLGFKRCVDYQNRFEFQHPAQWLADQTVARRVARRIEQQSALDPPPLRGRQPTSRPRAVAEPVVAYGPPGSSGEQNISVVVAPIASGFRLEGLGSPEEAARRFLEVTIAPPGSDKVAQLLSTSSRVDADGQLYYEMEYTVQAPAFYRHNVSAYAARDDVLYTLNAQCSQSDWNELQQQMQRAASSFKLF